MTYAYVTTECCVRRDAVAPGSYGRNDEPIHRNGDYTAWTRGKRETLAIIDGTHHCYRAAAAGYDNYLRGSALAVARLKGWA